MAIRIIPTNSIRTILAYWLKCTCCCQSRAKLWVIERTHAWQGRYRRNSKDYERRIESSTAMIQISHIHLMLNRLTHDGRPVFHYRKDAA